MTDDVDGNIKKKEREKKGDEEKKGVDVFNRHL
jgi:hypothetical protein